MTIQLLAMTSIKPDAEQALNKYLSVVGPLMESAGAKIVSRFELLDNVTGNNDIQYVTLLEYPNEASIKMVFESDEYRSLADVKEQAFSMYQVSKAQTL